MDVFAPTPVHPRLSKSMQNIQGQGGRRTTIVYHSRRAAPDLDTLPRPPGGLGCFPRSPFFPEWQMPSLEAHVLDTEPAWREPLANASHTQVPRAGL